MRWNLTAAVVAVGLCMLVLAVAIADVRQPVPESTRYTARRGSTNLPNPQPTTLEECRVRIRAAYLVEAQTRTGGSIVYQCIRTESHIVIFQPAPVGAAALSWTPPTRNTDGSTLNNLAGYRIHYGASPETLTQTVQLPNAGLTSYTIANLAPGTYYFAVRAYTSSGTESSNSNLAAKAVQ